MAQKLTYEEWRSLNTVVIDTGVSAALKQQHNIDADAEVESAMRREYEAYLAYETSKGD
jgi:hypothetical protein